MIILEKEMGYKLLKIRNKLFLLEGEFSMNLSLLLAIQA